MANEPARNGCYVALGLVVVLAGCAGLPLRSQPVIARAPQPPSVVSSGTEKHLRPCPQVLIAQTQWLARNMARLRLGFSKLQVVGIVGDPAHAETFQLTNGAVIEVLFYHTPATICRVQASLGAQVEGLMPMVFQDDRLIGYGPNYYRDFIVPMLRPKAVQASQSADFESGDGQKSALPEARVELRETAPLPTAPARTGRWVQEDLPTPPLRNSVSPSGSAARNGYTAPMQTDMYPVGYYEGGAAGARIGRGAPLR